MTRPIRVPRFRSDKTYVAFTFYSKRTRGLREICATFGNRSSTEIRTRGGARLPTRELRRPPRHCVPVYYVFQMITDGRYLHGVLDMALKLSAPVYFYLYDYQNEFSFNSLYGNLSKNLGITHGDELNSLFKMNTLNPRTLNALDAKVSRLMVDVWTKFATST